MKVNIKALALSTGLVAGLVVFLLTLWFVILGYSGSFLNKLGSVYLGYSVSWLGSIVGFLYGFLDGVVFGTLLGYLYNKFAK